ncbi:MAG: DUF1616 domain-containing protein [Thaumarchaeota archaeon]|nr:DUF1616 domain-containing protein [Nitrososphaerota archaeon]
MTNESRAKEVLVSNVGSGETVEEAVERGTKGTGEPKWGATRALYALIEEKKISLSDSSPPRTLAGYLRSPYSLWFWGAVVALALTFASIYVLPSSAPFVYVRYVFGSIAVLFLPGYTLIEALYPKKEDLDGLERLALSIGLSLALVPLVGLLLNYTPWGIRLSPIIVSLSSLDIALVLAGAYRKESYIKLAATANR